MLGPNPDQGALILDALDTGLIAVAREGGVVTWNAWMAAASGVPEAQALGAPLDALFPGAKLTRLTAAVSAALQSGTSTLLTHSLHPDLLPLKTRAGRPLVHNVSVRPTGRKPYALCVIQISDVTMASHREQVLRERQNARYDAVVESAPDAILTLDSEGRIQLANPAAAREFGYGARDLLGRPGRALFEEPEKWDAAWHEALDGVVPNRSVELVARRRDGSPSYLEVSASRWLSDSRAFVTVILRDVNERRAAEEALRRLNQTLERRVAERTADRDRMWRLSTDVMLVAQLDGTINAINPAWTQLCGWGEAEMIGANLAAFIPEDDRPKLAEALRELAASPLPRLIELRLETRHGGRRWMEWSAVAADGLLQAVGRDVTAEREASKALREAEEALRQSQKMEAIGQLTGGIAHDFNNLLTGIIGAMDVLKRRLAAGRYDDTQRFMDAAVASANRAAALTHRLLAFARRQPLDPKVIDANQLVRGMEDLLRRTLGEQIRLDCRLDGELWPTLTDASQLENAILNLAINARDAMPDGGKLTITTGNASIAERVRYGSEEVEPGDYTVVRVSDTGTGMAPDVVPKVFEPFFTTKAIGQGTGLGLSMIYGFAKQSRGHVGIETALGAGTTVSLYLPAHFGRGPLERLESQGEMPHGAGETVLLVEDDSGVRLLIAEVLRDLGYACIEANDGPAALPLLRSNARLDLMITDVGLPGMSGRHLAEIARRDRPDLKILFVTGYAEHATGRTRLLESGMEMVTKPFTLDALALKIREIIRSKPD